MSSNLAPAAKPCWYRACVQGDPAGVRETLVRVRDEFRATQASVEALDALELVLAEALNNVVEHAYRDQPGHKIDLQIGCRNGDLVCRIVDDGHPMPGLVPPKGRLPATDVPMEELPEGGFGWFLIQKMTKTLEYRRLSGTNRLTFTLTACEGQCSDCPDDE